MSIGVAVSSQGSLDEAVQLVEQLSPMDQLRLIMIFMPKVSLLFERFNLQLTPKTEELNENGHTKQKSLKGALSHLGTAPSFEEIQETRREMWSSPSNENNIDDTLYATGQTEIPKKEVRKRRRLEGAAAHLKPVPSFEDIKEIRREMWSSIGDEL
ncbi:MAG: hypothetical protein AAF639_16120 [Chloroflexota bacterium]